MTIETATGAPEVLTTSHPVTWAWWTRREKCRECSFHYVAMAPVESHKTERCRAYREANGMFPLCVDARSKAEERDDLRAGRCGPDAAMFVQRAGVRS